MNVADQGAATTLDACLCVFIHKGETVHQGETVKVLYPYDAQLEDELTIEPGDIIEVENKCGKWWRGKIMGKSQPAGLFYEEFTLPNDPAEECLPIQLSRGRIGYSVTFKESSYYVTEKPGSDLECIICQGLANDAHQTGCCGHTVCSTCGRRWKGKNNSCPHCRKSSLSLVDDPRTKRYISGLTVYCSHYDVGCDWKGSFNDINGHLRDDCQFTLVACKHYSCREKVHRHNLADHEMNKCPMRPVSCPCCNESRIERKIRSWSSRLIGYEPLTYHALISTHYNECPSWPVRCLNHCDPEEKLIRSTLQDHSEKCPDQVISCQFAEAGCTVRVKRREMDEHMQSQHVLDVASIYTKVKDENSALRIRNGDLGKDFASLQSSYNSLKKEHKNLESRYAYQLKVKTGLEKQKADKELADKHNALLVTEKSRLEIKLNEETAKGRSLSIKNSDLSCEKAALEEQITLVQGRCDHLEDLCDYYLREKRILEHQISYYAATIFILLVVLLIML